MTLSDLKDIARRILVTDYGDPRSYLQAVYLALKSADPHYSYQKFSEDLGLGSANAHGVISGRRPLTQKSALKIVSVLALVGVQKKYFLAMVEAMRAKTRGERDEAFAARMELRSKVLPTELDRKQLSFFEHWYHAAILEILRLPDSRDDAEWLSLKICPEISKQKVEESLALLLDLGYIARDPESQKLRPTDATISSGNEVLGLALQSYHRQMLGLSLDALDYLPREERDISAITITVSQSLVAQMKDDIIALRKRFLNQSAAESAPDDVVQLNIQLFSLLKRGD